MGEVELALKNEGLSELYTIFGKCYDLKDQLQLFASKCTPLMKTLFSNINHKTVVNDPLFDEFITNLKVFMS